MKNTKTNTKKQTAIDDDTKENESTRQEQVNRPLVSFWFRVVLLWFLSCTPFDSSRFVGFHVVVFVSASFHVVSASFRSSPWSSSSQLHFISSPSFCFRVVSFSFRLPFVFLACALVPSSSLRPSPPPPDPRAAPDACGVRRAAALV